MLQLSALKVSSEARIIKLENRESSLIFDSFFSPDETPCLAFSISLLLNEGAHYKAGNLRVKHKYLTLFSQPATPHQAFSFGVSPSEGVHYTDRKLLVNTPKQKNWGVRSTASVTRSRANIRLIHVRLIHGRTCACRLDIHADCQEIREAPCYRLSHHQP